MFSATLENGAILKKIVEAIKDLVQNVTLYVGENGISMQAMDATHVALVGLQLDRDGFNGNYRTDESYEIGVKLQNLDKILKCAGPNDQITLGYKADGSHLSLKFLGGGKSPDSLTPSLGSPVRPEPVQPEQ